jgi:UDP-N-acetylmuramate: L-alanyl-gamma-D-glutamyl-meso-diaminopimelate ligase
MTNPTPDTRPLCPSARVHVSGICGTGTGALASLLSTMGIQVRGSDDHVYPPMSTFLAERSVPILEGYRADHLADRPDWVVIGNALSRENPEAAAAEALGLGVTSFPAALERWVLPGRLPVVVAGTHGKTTTTTMVAHLLRHAGLDPGWLIGGIPLGLPGPAHLGSGAPFVIEGDEYDTAYFDKRSKFLHYRPQVAILTSIEFDHADIFRDLAAVRTSFAAFLDLLPADGHLVACADDPGVRDLVLSHPPACPVTWYGLGADAQVRPATGAWRQQAHHFDLALNGDGPRTFHLPMCGHHNLTNAVAALAACRLVGAPPAALCDGLAGFGGVRRRQEAAAEVDGVTVIDDFAHHPTAVAATLEALRTRYPGRRLWAVFEFRSNSAIRRIFHDDYRSALGRADRVALPPILRSHRLGAAELIEPQVLAGELHAAGTTAYAATDLDDLLVHLENQVRSGDVVTVMSSGAFDGLIGRLVRRLARRGSEKTA